MKERLGGEAAVVGSIISPFFMAAELRGFENTLMDLFTSPHDVVRMIGVALESSKRYADRAADLGLDAVFIDDSTATGQLISPEMAESYDVAHLKELVAYMRKAGLRTIVHNDAQQPYLDLQAAVAPSCLHFNNDYVDLAETFERFRGKVSVMAGINHQELIFRKSPEEVEAAVKRTIELYGDAPGLLIAPGCEIPFKSPLENIVRLRQACERHGRYQDQNSDEKQEKEEV
jgi:uroporphyrinogen decarboxylase